MTEKVPSLSPGRGTLTNKWVPKPKPVQENKKILKSKNLMLLAFVTFNVAIFSMSHLQRLKVALVFAFFYFRIFSVVPFNDPLWSTHSRLYAYQPWRYKIDHAWGGTKANFLDFLRSIRRVKFFAKNNQKN